MARSKAYLFRGVEIRWKCAKSLLPKNGSIPEEESFHFPGGLKDFVTSEIGARARLDDAARVHVRGHHTTFAMISLRRRTSPC